jgi:ribosomal protein S18 acetylase RimI-like enzyme
MIASGEQRRISYFKRYRMEIDLYDSPPPATLPDGYTLVRWQPELLERHAEVLYYSFCDEIDAKVFPSLGNRQGCLSLMGEISRKPGFLPEATWLVAHGEDYCGTIQGIRERTGQGAIQNVGITWAHRRKGLGSALLMQALHGFRRAGLGRAFLEVTAQNELAVQLYWRLGFRRRRTVYKAVEVMPGT